MDPHGIGIVGIGNIGGGYARDILTHPESHLVAATDLDPVRLRAFGQQFGCTAHVRPPFEGIDRARDPADMAFAIEEGRPHRASAEQAVHVVDILEAAATSMAADGSAVAVDSTFTPPAPMPSAVLPSAG